MIEDDDITIDMTLSDAEKEAIYKEMQEADILKSVEDASKVTCADPHEENKFNLTLNGQTYEMEWITSYCKQNADKKLQDFTVFIQTEMISKKSEYNNLPKASGGYD